MSQQLKYLVTQKKAPMQVITKYKGLFFQWLSRHWITWNYGLKALILTLDW